MLHRPARGLRPAALFPILLALIGVASAAPERPPRADPLDAAAAVPQAVHLSAFRSYRTYRDEAIRSWTEANDEVARIGGWRTYAREAAVPDAAAAPPAAAPASSPAAKPLPQGTGGPVHHFHH
jgi:hypothetical protein